MLTQNAFTNLAGAINAGLSDIIFVLLFAVVSVAVILVFIFLLTRFIGKKDLVEINGKVAANNNVDVNNASEETAAINKKSNSGGKFNFAALMAMILLLGLVLRLLFTFLITGYRPEFNKITELMGFVGDKGLMSNYYSVKGINIYPVSYYIFSIFGSFASLFNLSADSVVMPLLVKLPLIICDLLTAFLLYKISKKYINSYVAIIIAAFVCVCPIFIFASSVWGSIYSMLALVLVSSLYFVARKNYPALIGVYGLSLLVSFEAIYIFPLIAVFVIYNFIKAVKFASKAKLGGMGEIFKNKDTAPALTIPISIIATTLIMYLISLPLLINSIGGSFFNYIFTFFLQPFSALKSFGSNSLGIFNIFMRNGVALDSSFPSVIFAVIFGVIITGIVLLTYLSKKNRANLVFLGGYVIFTLATYFVNFSELSLLPVLSIFLLAFLLLKDKRILKIFGVLSLVMVINASVVMVSAGYLNNLDNSLVSSSNPNYVGNLILTGGGGAAVSIICSALAIIAHLYATLMLLDISMSNKRVLLYDGQNAGFKKSMAMFFKNK